MNNICLILITGYALFFLGGYSSKGKEKVMKLVHPKTGFVVAEEEKNTLVVHDRFLERDLKKNGIPIPVFLREKFNRKAVVRCDDENFPRAFKEVLIPFSLASEKLQWQE
jgi:hypothetical protein